MKTAEDYLLEAYVPASRVYRYDSIVRIDVLPDNQLSRHVVVTDTWELWSFGQDYVLLDYV